MLDRMCGLIATCGALQERRDLSGDPKLASLVAQLQAELAKYQQVPLSTACRASAVDSVHSVLCVVDCGVVQPYIPNPAWDPIHNATLRAHYDCVTDIRPWWGNFSGPCCRPKREH